MSDSSFLIKMDRSVITISDIKEQDPLEETRFWLSKTPAERIAGVETLRQRAHHDYATTRLQRVYTIRKLKES